MKIKRIDVEIRDADPTAFETQGWRFVYARIYTDDDKLHYMNRRLPPDDIVPVFPKVWEMMGRAFTESMKKDS